MKNKWKTDGKLIEERKKQPTEGWEKVEKKPREREQSEICMLIFFFCSWDALGVEIFLRDNPTTEALFLTAGVLEFLGSLLAVHFGKQYFLRNYKFVVWLRVKKQWKRADKNKKICLQSHLYLKAFWCESRWAPYTPGQMQSTPTIDYATSLI